MAAKSPASAAATPTQPGSSAREITRLPLEAAAAAAGPEQDGGDEEAGKRQRKRDRARD